MTRKFRVHLIGSGYESVKFYMVFASSPNKAFDLVADLAENDGFVMGVDYLEMECECL